jgi:hypothetical protein
MTEAPVSFHEGHMAPGAFQKICGCDAGDSGAHYEHINRNVFF